MGLGDSLEQAYNELKETVYRWDQQASKWTAEKWDILVETSKNDVINPVTSSIEEVMEERKRFIRKVPFKYRCYVLGFSTGLVFIVSRGIVPRLVSTTFAGALTLSVFTPELSPFNRRY